MITTLIRKFKSTTLLLGIVSSLFAGVATAAEWSYADATGPDKWASLSPDYGLCGSGKNQSPIDIDSKKMIATQVSGIKFNYGMISPNSITNTGNLIQVEISGDTNIKTDDIEFALKRLEFHIPSEHTIDGEHFPMELQFIHESKDNQIAIVSRMVVPGRPDRTLRKLFENLPMQAGQSERLTANALRSIEVKKKFGNYFRYNGSTTTPPCTEGVRWYLMNPPMTFSKEQYEKLKAAVKQDNNRPIQKLNARVILK